MNSNWQKAKEIFAAGVEIDPANRGKFLDEACGGDAALRREVQSLIEADDAADSFMAESAISEVADVMAQPQMIEKGRLFGQYEIAELIGAGGMGEIYLARDTRLNRKVAIKLLPTDAGDPKNKLARFEHEARVVSALNHPNILTIHDFGTLDGGNFIVSEFVEGVTLRKKISDGITTGEAIDVALQIASALSSAHNAGIVHRDIKPENVMVRPDGLVKILDFGIAKLVDASGLEAGVKAAVHKTKTGPGMILGTVNYMSPEQARGTVVDLRSDIFSFGVVLYEMLAGKAPFDEENPIDTISKVLYKEPEALSKFLPGVLPELEHLVVKMLAKDRNERYGSVDEVVRHLSAVKAVITDLQMSGVPTGHFAADTNDNKVEITAGDAAENVTVYKTASSAEYLITKLTSSGRGLAAVVVVFVLAAGALGYWMMARKIDESKNIRSVAVMPFVNATGNAELEYLADGMAETLISGLSRLPGLMVKARGSVFRYKGKEIAPTTVGSELGVRAVLIGRIKTRGDELIVDVELVDTGTENVLWAAAYNGKASDLIRLQSQIARDVSSALQPHASSGESSKVTKNYTADYETFQHYLRGRYYWNKRTGPDLKRAIAEFELAVARDQNFALAFVGLADSYALLEQYTGTPASETLPKAKASATRALEIDDTLAEAHASLAFIHYTMWEWAASDAQFRRAIEINPNYSTAHHWYYVMLRDSGRLKEALEQIRLARELDPLSMVINVSHSRAQFRNGNSVAGFEATADLIRLYPDVAANYLTLGIAYIREGRPEEGLAEIRKAYELERSSQTMSSLAFGCAMTGRTLEAKTIIKELEAKYLRRESLGRQVAIAYLGLGDLDKTFEWLEKDFVTRSSELQAIFGMAEFDGIRNDPRYIDLRERIGLGREK